MGQPTDFSAWQRQHPLGIIVMGARNLWNVAKSLWPLVFTLWSQGAEAVKWALLGVAVLLAVVGVFSVAQYLRFGFRLRGGSLHVRKGVFQRSRTIIPLDRVQAVHLKRNPLQRALGLTGLSVDTAGSKGNELELRALRMAFAQELQVALASSQGGAEEAEPEPLLELGMRDLLRIALGSNHLRNGLLVVALPLSILGQVDGLVEAWVEAIPTWVWALLSLLVVVLWLPALVAVGMLGVASSVVVVVVRFFGLRLDQTQSGQFLLQSGLLKRVAFTIHRTKIQTVKWVSTPLTRALGFTRVHWAQARAGGTEAAKEGLDITGVTPAMRDRLNGLLFPHWRGDLPKRLRPVPAYAWVLWLRWWLPAGALLASGAWWGWPVVVLGAGAWMARRRAAGHFVRYTQSDLAVYSGWWKRTCTMTQVHQVQRVGLRQSFWHAHRHIAHVQIYTAAGNLRLRFLPEQEARQFVDFLLHETERSTQPWM